MTNLEHYVISAEDSTDSEDILGSILLVMKDEDWKKSWWKSKHETLKDWLMAEYKQYKLTQFEYDLLRACDERTPLSHTSFCMHDILMKMKKYGYYKQIENTDYFIGCILENSEVVHD